MKRSTFLLITAILSFAFGTMMFFAPAFAANFLALKTSPQTISVLRGLGGLIIGSGAINFFLHNQQNTDAIRGLLLANIITHLFGILADVWGAYDGALTIYKFAPVEITHMIVGVGSLIYLLQLKSNSDSQLTSTLK